MDAILTSTPTMPLIATSKVLANDQFICNILIFFLRLKTSRYTLIYQRKRAFRRILKRLFSILIFCEQPSSLMAFNRYIKNLHSYLLSFMKKTRPLEDLESHQRNVAADFDKKW